MKVSNQIQSTWKQNNIQIHPIFNTIALSEKESIQLKKLTKNYENLAENIALLVRSWICKNYNAIKSIWNIISIAKTNNLEIMIELGWIKNTDNIHDLKDIIINSNPEVFKILVEEKYIKNIDDAIKLEDILAESKPEVLAITLEKLDIQSLDDLILLRDILRDADPENLLTIINDADITDIRSIHNLYRPIKESKNKILKLLIGDNKKDILSVTWLKADTFIIAMLHTLKKSNIKILQILQEQAKIEKINDIIEVQYSIKKRKPEELEENINTLKEYGIKDPDNLVKFKKILALHPKRVHSLITQPWINDTDELEQAQDILIGSNPDNLLILNEYSIITNVKDLYILRNVAKKSKPKNLRIIIQKANIKKPMALKEAEEILEKSYPRNLKLLVEQAEIKNIKNLIIGKNILSSFLHKNLKLLVEQAGINNINDLIKAESILQSEYVFDDGLDEIESVEELYEHTSVIKIDNDFSENTNAMIEKYNQSQRNMTYNLKILIEKVGIRNINDLIEAETIIRESYPQTLNMFIEKWIIDNYVLTSIADILPSENTENLKKNIESLEKIDVLLLDDFEDFTTIKKILFWDNYILENRINELRKNGVIEPEDFLKLLNIKKHKKSKKNELRNILVKKHLYNPFYNEEQY